MLTGIHEQDVETTKVIFRKWHNGNVIALFPELPGTNRWDTCLSYEHVGQHGAASVSLPGYTETATEQEYRELQRELEQIGYKLQVVQRFTPTMRRAREREIFRN